MAIKSDKDKLTGLPEKLRKLVIDISNEYDKEDRLEREEKRPLWTKLELYFNGIQRIYWNMTAKDWRVLQDDQSGKETNRHYDKIINIYRPHGEAIIAALSVKPPTTIFYPHDADVEEDLVTAKLSTTIKADIEKTNRAQLLMIKTLMILYNQGTAMAYVYNKSDSKYGTYSVPKFGENITRYTVLLNCKECGSNLDEVIFESEKGKVQEEIKECPVCGYKGHPQEEEYEEQVPQIVGSQIHAKEKTCIDIFSPLFVYVPFYARKQEQIPYVRLRFEQHIASLINVFPNLKKKDNRIDAKVDSVSAEERQIYVGVNSNNLCTVDCWWVRDWAYDVVHSEESAEDIKELREKYPDGYYAVIIDDKLISIHNENLDDHWTISENPLSTYIHGEPHGKPLAPIQDIQNEVVDLQVETFEHAIPETWARGDVVDFERYKKERALPGMMYPAKAPDDGTGLGQSFHTIKTATLSEESGEFLNRLQTQGQFVVGSFPSIYGGPATSGSKTAREYTESRAMALQRLSLPWTTLKYFWASIMSLAVPLRIHALKKIGDDEKVVVKNKETGFINVWLKQEDLNGRIGTIEADPEEEMPQSAMQLKDLLINMVTLKDPNISAALYHPQNTPFLTKALGAPEFYIPGSDDRDKQFGEISQMLLGNRIEVKEWENHKIEAETCRSFIVGPTGRMLQRSNPEGIALIEEHMMAHNSMMMAPTSPEAVNSELEGV